MLIVMAPFHSISDVLILFKGACTPVAHLPMRVSTAYRGLFLVLLFGPGICLPAAASTKHHCAPDTNAQSEAIVVIEEIFAAARTDDLPALLAVTTPDFYAYDGGRRFTAQSLMELVASAHAAGKRYEWSVTDPEVHVHCDFAWVTYINQGSIEDSAGRQESTWLESVVLEYAGDHWKARFLHSTHVPGPR
jgi:ketosteroid isomerase-like protein